MSLVPLVAQSGKASCFRIDTLATLSLASARDLDAWDAAAAQLRATAHEVTLDDLLRYQRAVVEQGDDLRWAEATVDVLRALLDADGESKAILAYCQELLSHMERVPSERRSQVYNLIGNARSAAGDESSSIPAYLKAIETARPDVPNDLTSAYGNYALSLLVLGDTATAMEATRKCIALSQKLVDPEVRAYNNVWDYVGLANLFFNRGQLDSAHANLARGVAAFHTFGSSYERYAELGEFVWDVQFNFFIHDGDYPAARLMVDSLRAVEAGFVDLSEAEWYASQEEYASAIALLEGLADGNSHVERQRFDLLIEYAQALGDPALVAKYALAKAERAEADKRNNQTSFAELANEYRETFEKETAAKAYQHATEVALLRSRQRLWMALALGLVALGFAAYAVRRYRRSDAHSHKLSGIVSRQGEDLARVNVTLARQVEDLQDFNHLLSHDLREPLRSISGFARLVGRRVGSYPDIAEDFAFLRSGIDQLSDLHEAVERYRKIREYVSRPKAVDAVSVVRAIVDQVATARPDAELSLLTVHAPAHLVDIDADLLRVVVRELLNNAVKFCRKAPHVTIEIKQRGRMLCIAVDDDGIGVNGSYAETIFGVFKRLNRREDFAGAGMGLAIARTASQHLGGTIALTRATPGAGARVELLIPAAPMGRRPSPVAQEVIAA